jgi:hypothetical protein
MYWARAVKGKGTRVFRGSVALMILQTIGRVKRGEFLHGMVSRHLGNDRGSRDGGAPGIPVDDGKLSAGQSCLLIAVNQTKMRLDAQALNGTAHGEKTGTKDIVGFNLLQGCDAKGPVDLGMAAQEMTQLSAIFGQEQLRVVEMPVLQTVGQDRRRCVDRSGPAPAPYLIHAGHDGHALRPQSALEFPAERVATFADHDAANLN